MTHTVAFPGLGLEFEINRGIEIGSFTIYWYAVIIAAGFLLAMSFIFKYSKKFGIDSDRGTDVIFFTMILGIIGARLYYVVFNWESYAGNLGEIFNTRGGGLGFYGGIIGGLLGVIIGCRVCKVPEKPFLDVVGGALFIGQGIGRWGNFVNGECFGVNTTLPWGMTGSNITSFILSHTDEEMGAHVDPFLPVHPTFLYESLWCLIGLIVFIKIMDRRRFDGEMFIFYIAWNGFGRFFIEGLRTDSLMVGNIKVSQLLGAVMFIAGALFIKTMRSKIAKAEAEGSDHPEVWGMTENGRLMGEGKWDYKTGLPVSEDTETPEAGDAPEEENETNNAVETDDVKEETENGSAD